MPKVMLDQDYIHRGVTYLKGERDVPEEMSDFLAKQREKEEEVVASTPGGSQDFSKLKVDALRQLAISRGVEGADEMKKAELVEALEAEG
jgi:protein involved in ribonucleotide reduction